MDIEHILNDCLNKAMCQKGRIQHPNSNNIADFVNKYLKAINYTHCCKSDSEQLLAFGKELLPRKQHFMLDKHIALFLKKRSK